MSSAKWASAGGSGCLWLLWGGLESAGYTGGHRALGLSITALGRVHVPSVVQSWRAYRCCTRALTQHWTWLGWNLAWAVPWIPSVPADAMEEGLGVIHSCLVSHEGNCTSLNNLTLIA